MHPRHRRCHTTVTLVRDDDRRPSFSDHKICTGDAHVSVKKVRTKNFSSLVGQFFDIVKPLPTMLFGEQISDIIFGLVCRRSNNVRGMLSCLLNDVFAKVSLLDINTVPLKKTVKSRFLADHRLRLYDLLDLILFRDVRDNRIQFLR